MMIGEYYVTEDEAEIAELLQFASRGSCEEKVSLPPPDKAPVAAPEVVKEEPKPEEDLAVVPGIGKRLLGKLTEAGITTQTQLKEGLKKEEVKALLGTHLEKIIAYFDSL